MKLNRRFKSFAAALLALVMLAQPFGAIPARADEQYDKTNTLLALNMAIVSVKNIVTTQDRVVLDQEYNTIINHLSVGDIESDYELVNVYKDLMDVITQNKLSDEEAKRFAAKYDRRQKNAIVGALAGIRPYGGNMWSFLGSLFTQGVSAYFGYRDAKEQMKEELGDSLWQLEKEKVIRFNDLQKDLLAATWSLLRKYRIDDKYRITQEDLDLLEYGLAETDKENAVQIFRELERKFAAYPPFWFYYGDAAYKCGDTKTALECFDEFDKVWRHVLRQDPYKVQIAKYRLMLEQNPPKERVVALLKDIKDNSGPREWLDNLFYGAVSFSVGEKDKGIRAVNNNILFKAETEISPVVLASMKSGKLNMSKLPKEIADAVAKAVPEMAIDTGLEQKSAPAAAVSAITDSEKAAKRSLEQANILLSKTVNFKEPASKAAEAADHNFEYVRKMAENGDRAAQFVMALVYSEGANIKEKGVNIKKDPQEAASMMRKLAQQGVSVAQYSLASYYMTGSGVPQDFTEAVKWLERAAEQNLSDALVARGTFYAKGAGVPKDVSKALKDYLHAFELGNGDGALSLAQFYNAEARYEQAYQWAYLSVLYGVKDGQKILDSVEGKGFFDSAKLSKDGLEKARTEAKKIQELCSKGQKIPENVLEANQGAEVQKKNFWLGWNGVLDDEDVSYYLHSTGEFLPKDVNNWYNIIPRKSDKKFQNARKSMKIPDGENVFVLYDSTVFGSNKEGVALGKKGIFGKEPFKDPIIVKWSEFKDALLVFKSPTLKVGEKAYYMNFGDGDNEKREYRRLLDFQTYLRKKYQ